MKAIRIFIAAVLGTAALCLAGCAVSFGAGSTYPNADKYTAGDREITGQIHALEIDWPSGAVTVRTDSTETVTVKETTKAELSENQKVHTWVDGDTLHVQFCKSGSNYTKKEPKTVEITLPESVGLETLEIDVASADVDCTGISAKTAQLDASSGDLSFDGSADAFKGNASSGDIHFTGKADRIETNTSSGQIAISQSGQSALISADASSGDITVSAEQADQVKTNTSSGKHEIRLQAVPQETTVNTSAGDVRLYLPEQADLTARISTASGDVNFELPMSKTADDTYVCGSGSNSLKISTSSGDISILKN